MEDMGLNSTERAAVNIMKTLAILSVIAAHVVSVTDGDLFSHVISALWSFFARIGVVIFFMIGGFLYTRKPHDTKAFWKKKLSRIVIPWVCCSAVTYGIAVACGRELSLCSYFRWILGSGTWYYYITVYTFFLFIFKWFHDKDLVLGALIAVQTVALLLASFGRSTTVSLGFFTDYLNPLHWIGYFSLGILIRRHRLDQKIRRSGSAIAAALLALLVLPLLYHYRIYTYFHILTSVFCLSAAVVLAAAAYRAAASPVAKHLEKPGTYSYCIFLLHMQIVQAVDSRIPENGFTLLLSPFIGLGVMLMLIAIGLLVCRKLPFGEKIKALAGL